MTTWIPGPGQGDLVRLGPAMPARGVETADGDDPDLVGGDRWVVGHRVRRGQCAALTGRDRRRPRPEGRRANAEAGGEPVYRAEHHGAHEDRHEEAFHPSDAARHDPLHSVPLESVSAAPDPRRRPAVRDIYLPETG